MLQSKAMQAALTLALAACLMCFSSTFAEDNAEVSASYKLAPEDVLLVSVWKEEGLTHEVVVRPDGKLSFPLVGHIQAAGRTPEEVQAEIALRLKKFIPEPVVTVAVKTVVGNKIFVIGKVARPGVYNLGRNVDVLQALTVAGGLTPFAAQNNIKIIRRTADRQIIFTFRYGDVIKGSNLKQNIMLMGGDTVVVN